MLFIHVVKYEYQIQWGFDHILGKAEVQSWDTKLNRKRVIQDAKLKEESRLVRRFVVVSGKGNRRSL